MNKQLPNAALVDVLDKVIQKGAYLEGDILLRLADIDFLFIKLKLVIAATPPRNEKRFVQEMSDYDHLYTKKMEKQIKNIEKNINLISQLDDPASAEKGLAKLVLTLVDLLRELLEREALRKIDRRELSETEIEKVSLTFTAIEKKIEELKKVFGIKEDLNLDLGPLGKLL